MSLGSHWSLHPLHFTSLSSFLFFSRSDSWVDFYRILVASISDMFLVAKVSYFPEFARIVTYISVGRISVSQLSIVSSIRPQAVLLLRCQCERLFFRSCSASLASVILAQRCYPFAMIEREPLQISCVATLRQNFAQQLRMWLELLLCCLTGD